jgi:hypothetical protein
VYSAAAILCTYDQLAIIMPSVNQTSCSQRNPSTEERKNNQIKQKMSEAMREMREHRSSRRKAVYKSKHVVELSDASARFHSNQNFVAGQQAGVRPPIL